MTMRGAMMLLSACGLVVAGCGGGGSASTCGNGQPCSDGGDGPACGDGQPCGDDGGPAPACGRVQACGGDVVGNWMFVEECETTTGLAALRANFSMTAAQTWCPGQTLVGVEPQASGSVVFDASGRYALDLVFGGYLNINFPASCIAGVSCDDATAGFQAQIDAGTYPLANLTSITCSGSSNCLCRAAVYAPQSESGTYSISGSVLTFASTTGAVTDKSYCVEGSRLHILKTSLGSMAQTVIASDLVATKQ